MIQIKWIDVRDNLLADVKILGKQNAKTLGLFPEGAFDEHARRRRIVAALIDGKLAGYVLFRITQSKQILFIAHLCIHPDQRKTGVARKLLDTVREKHRNDCNGMSLSCRKDYVEASAFWQKYGFKPKAEKRSRSKEEHYLIQWYYDFGNRDLFSQATTVSEKINAVLDANILIKLCDDTSGKEEEVLALQADWLTDEVDYHHAQEIHVEINGDQDRERKEQTRKFIGNYNELRWSHEEIDRIYPELQSILPGTSSNDHCDRRQIAETIASGMDFFITLDTGILNAAEKLEGRFGVKVARPSEFILNIDYLRNEANYRSYRVAGARFEYHQITAHDTELLCSHFVAHKLGEKLNTFKAQVHSIAADIGKSVVKIVRDHEGKPVGFFAVSFNNGTMEIKVIRTVKTKIGYLLFQQMIGDIFKIAAQKSASALNISDSFMDKDKEEILFSFGFQQLETGWFKVLLQGQLTITQILDTDVVSKNFNTPAIRESLNDADLEEKIKMLYHFERLLFPVKILDLDLPTYIVPIRPFYASQLFDQHAAKQTLFGANVEQAWRKENIYYRSIKPVSEKAPGRILWYISAEKKYQIGRSSGIAAVSYLDEVYIDAAKRLYQKFKDFGIYTWDEIYSQTDKNAMQEIKALRFSDTEVFEKIVPFSRIGEIFKQFGRSSNTFASPVEITPDIFHEIYRLGKTTQ